MKNKKSFKKSELILNLDFKIAFTLVELMVVIVIVAILATISIVFFMDYPRDARDSKRESDISNIITSIKNYNIENWEYPIPDESIEIKMNWWVIAYQWVIWENLLSKLGISSNSKDPSTEKYYTYTT